MSQGAYNGGQARKRPDVFVIDSVVEAGRRPTNAQVENLCPFGAIEKALFSSRDRCCNPWRSKQVITSRSPTFLTICVPITSRRSIAHADLTLLGPQALRIASAPLAWSNAFSVRPQSCCDTVIHSAHSKILKHVLPHSPREQSSRRRRPQSQSLWTLQQLVSYH